MADKLKHIGKTKWYFFHKRHRTPFFQLCTGSMASIQTKWCPFDNRTARFGLFNDYENVDLRKKILLRNRALAYFKKHPRFLLQFMAHAYRDHAHVTSIWRITIRKNFPSYSNAQLAGALHAYVQQLYMFGGYISLPLFLEDYFEEILQKRFAELFGEKCAYWFGVAVDPVKDGTVLQEEIELLQLACTSRVTSANIARHAEKFSFMANVGFFEKYYDESYYRRRLAQLQKNNPQKKLRALRESRSLHQKEFNELLQKVRKAKDGAYLAQVIKTANEAVYFRSFRTEIFYASGRYHSTLFKAMAKRLGITNYADILWFYWDELYHALRGTAALDLRLIATRKKGYAFITGLNGDCTRWDGRDAENAFALYHKAYFGSLQNTNTVKGMSAFRGIVKGVARVVASVAECDALQKNEILVTHATNINFVPYLKKVSGIVTEEGGILSHASIISRELKIPCVIGTKNATQVIKTGDIIKIDANRGEVKIISRA